MKKTLRHIFMTRIGLCQTAYFIGAIALILYFFPREEKSEYVFQEGKPWKYGLLTAAYDFPIYKSEEQLKHEQDSVVKTLRPFFTEEPSVGTAQINNFKREHQSLLQSAESADAYRYVLKALAAVYQRGIIDTDTYNSLIHNGTPGVRIVSRNTVKEECEVSELLSLRSAYEYIMTHATVQQQQILNSCNLNNYLSENLTYDSLKSQNARYELLQRIPSSIGMVQKGEKIINRGDIVTPHTYLILQSFETVNQRNNTRTHQQELFIMLGQALVIICLLIFLYRYLAIFYPRTFNDPKKLAFIMIMITGTTVICYLLCGMFTTSGMYLVPFAILPITIVVFLKKSIALISSLISILLCAFVVPYPLEFIFLQTAVTVTAINNMKELVRRSQLLRCVILIFVTYCFTYTGYTLIFEDWTKLDPQLFFYLGINCGLLFFTYLLIYLLEKVFGFVSTVTLVELSDINLPIFRQLSEVCPGTFQHSMQVSNLATEAADCIGAQAQLVRTGALYHDIGKMANPTFFTENQNGVNPHNGLPYEESAQIVISHVKDGVKIAEKLNLPQTIIDFIKTHHGRSKAKYFYNSYVNEHPDEEVNEELFTYPGPNPFTKEQAILMMADAVEAASRSLKEYTEENISKLVNSIIDSQIADGLLNNSPISFRDICDVKAAFIEKLKTMYHTRISYPELHKK